MKNPDKFHSYILWSINTNDPLSQFPRAPRGRTITVAYLATIESPEKVIGQDDAAKAEWFPITELPHLAFDHYDIMQDAVKTYAKNVDII